VRPPVLELRDVTKRFGSPRKPVWALTGLSFKVHAGETLGIVGESGSGKSTLARIVVGLEKPTSGEVLINGNSKLSQINLASPIQMVFQDPASSLDPLLPIFDSVREPLGGNRSISSEEKNSRVMRALEEVGLGSEMVFRHPNELSGGQKQRASLARAIVSLPPMIVCDEAVTALDVSIRAQVLNLLRTIQAQHNTAFIFISHDLCTVSYMSDRIIVMYLGAVMEMGEREQLFSTPAHPYTHSLLSAVPALQQGLGARLRMRLKGDPPSVMNMPPGCRFQTRCPLADGRCRQEQPELRQIADGHYAACHYAPVSAHALEAATHRAESTA
jgi:oligopeptide/dipeptide ABC transporter ATP-binding protein